MQKTVLAAAALALVAGTASAQFTLTLLHNNDAESRLLGNGDVGGAARFASVVARERASSVNPILLSSGDSFLAGRAFAAGRQSFANGGLFYDAEVISRLNYDAVIMGNHEYDFGPGVLADFIEASNRVNPTTFLSANLDVSPNPALAAQQALGRIGSSKIITLPTGDRVGIVGATTPNLRRISSPGDVIVNLDVVNAIQSEIDDLRFNQGVQNIVLVSHLQSVNEDLAIIPQLRGVDVAIAGGGDELLANPGTPLNPGNTPSGPYPLTANDLDGNPVSIVTTRGAYEYLGRIEVDFDASGNVTGLNVANSFPRRVIDASTGFADGVVPDAGIVSDIQNPVAAFSAALDANIIAQVAPGIVLDGRRSVVRTQESAMGNLAADSLAFVAEREFGGTLSGPLIGIQNGGGIRNDVVISDGDISEGDTFDILPFSNFVTVIEDVSTAELVEALENAVSRVEFTDGRFLQVSGIEFTYDISQPGSIYDAAGNLVSLGSRIVEVMLADGTVLVDNGQIVADIAIDIASIDFLLNGGDFYDIDGAGRFLRSGVSYQEALAQYLSDATGLNGLVSGSAYDGTGPARITQIPAPASALLLGIGGLAAIRRRR